MAAKFISIDGIEGSGKSTHIIFIKKYLATKGIKAYTTREPGGTDIGVKIRQLLLNNNTKITPKTETLLIFAARAEHVQTVIKPKLKQGIWVISDRFTDASYAYQGGGRDLGFSAINTLEKWSLGNFKPDLSIFLDVELKLSKKRIQQRGKLDRFETEKQEFFQKTRKAFLTLARQNTKRIKVIEASQQITQIKKQIKQVIDEVL